MVEDRASSAIHVAGAGLMGPAAVYALLQAADVHAVDLSDARHEAARASWHRFERLTEIDKLRAFPLDLAERKEAAWRMEACHVVVAAVPPPALGHAIRAAADARRPVVALTWPLPAELAELRELAESRGILVVPGCGVEPGLTEILARRLAEDLDRVDELHIKCGGIPERPAPPLGYKIVFGGDRLPLRDTEAETLQAGRVIRLPRYSGVEAVAFAGVGECEAWHDGLKTWLLDLPAFRSLRVATQKTVRWPGYAAKVSVLRELGLLGLEPVDVDGVPVVPKRVVDAVLGPRVRLEPGERDLTLLRVEVIGEAGGHPARRAVEMVDRFDDATGLTSMARTTGFTAAIVARMVADGGISGTGFRSPEQLVAGRTFERLIEDLALLGVHLTWADG
jgi:saccharopine dehydrogenase-like NADP-dependent oxidoreductase